MKFRLRTQDSNYAGAIPSFGGNDMICSRKIRRPIESGGPADRGGHTSEDSFQVLHFTLICGSQPITVDGVRVRHEPEVNVVKIHCPRWWETSMGL